MGHYSHFQWNIVLHCACSHYASIPFEMQMICKIAIGPGSHMCPSVPGDKRKIALVTHALIITNVAMLLHQILH